MPAYYITKIYGTYSITICVLLSQVMYTQMGIHQMRVTDGLTMLGFLDVFKYHHR